MDVTFFTGITGMDKSNFIQKIIERSGKQDEIMHIEFEDELTNSARPGTTPADMPSFLDMKNPYLKMKIISDTFEWISQKIAKNQPDIKHIFFYQVLLCRRANHPIGMVSNFRFFFLRSCMI